MFVRPLHYTASAQYRPDVDGLRTVAIVFVILAHAFPQFFGGGFVGVDIFFAISGYLIAGIIFKELKAGRFSFWDFYAKRARRIFPALIFVLIVGTILGALFLTPREFKELGKEGMFGALFFENFRMARGIGYFDLETQRKTFMHLWSLGVEEQFYLVFPLLTYWAWRWLKGKLGWLLVLIAVLSFAVEIYYQPISDSKAYFYPHCRFWQLGAGVLLAYLHFKAPFNPIAAQIKAKLEQFGSALSTLALVTLLVILGTYGRVSDSYPGYWALLPSLCSVLIIASGQQAWVNRVLLSHKISVYIGWLSYPLYLWHWVFLSLAFSILAGEVPTSVTFTMIGLSVLFAWISFTFIESPIRALPATKGLLGKTLVGLLITAFITGMVSLFDGFPSRLSALKQEALTTITNDRQVPPQYRCPNETAYVCLSKTRQLDGEVLIIGNSHTEHIANLFLERAPEGVRADVFAAGGTRPLLDVVQSYSSKQLIRDGKMHQVLAATLASPAKVVIISNTWGTPNDNEVVLLKNGARSTFGEMFTKTMEAILSSGKKLVFLVDNPHMPNEMENCMGLRPINLVKGVCSITREEYDQQSQGQFAYFDAWVKRHPGSYVLNTGVALCNDQTCSMVSADGKPLYTDTHHVTDLGARQLVDSIWTQLTAIPGLLSTSAPHPSK